MRRTNAHRPVIGVIFTVILTVIYYWIGDSSVHNQFSTGLIAVTFGFATFVIVRYTVDWLWRAVGVLIAIAGIALTYFLLWGKGGGYINFNQLWTRSILRATLDFGGALTMLGLLKYVFERRRGKHVPLMGWLDTSDDGYTDE